MKTPFEQNWFDAFVTAGQRLNIPAGETLHHASDPLRHIGLILSGELEGWRVTADGKEVWLGSYGVGDVIGSARWIPRMEGDFDIIALTAVRLIQMTPERFSSLCNDYSEMPEDFLSRIASLLKDSQNSLVNAQTLDAKSRIKVELLRLSEPVGVTPSHRIIRPSPIFADMARRANTTRETVSRTITTLCRSGVLEKQPGALLILDADKLTA